MVFDFAAQPPELISAKVYSGPGAESLQSAAAAWDALAGELQSTAAQFESTIAGLVSGDWTGPSSEAAAAAAAPYVSWLSTTAGQAEQTASQARAAANAYETALAATVPPAEILANRTQLLSLLPANIFGQNNAAIAALEAEYAQFWAQDVAAITGYAGSSQAATTGLGSFTEAPATTNDSGQAAQTAATASAAPSDLESLLEQAEATFSNFLTQVGSVNSSYTNFFTSAINSVPGGSYLTTTWTNLSSMISGVGGQATWTNVVNSSTGMSISQWKNFFVYTPWSHGVPLGSLNGGLSSPGHSPAGSGGAGGVGGARQRANGRQVVGAAELGRCYSGDQAGRDVVTGQRFCRDGCTDDGAPAERAESGQFGKLGRRRAGQSRIARRHVDGGPGQGHCARARTKGPVPLDKVIAQLQEQPDQVQHWNVDEAGLDDLVAKLSTKPGIHAVHLTDGKATAAVAKAATETG